MHDILRMPDSFISLLATVEHASFGDEHLRVFTQDAAGTKNTYLFTPDQLDALHQELRPTLARLYAYYRQHNDIDALLGDELRNLWAHCTQPRSVVDGAGQTHRVSHVTSISCAANPPHVALSARLFRDTDDLTAEEMLDAAVSGLPFCGYTRYLVVSLSWMNTNYPGWKERYETGLTFQYSGRALADYVCNDASAVRQPLALTGVSFD